MNVRAIAIAAALAGGGTTDPNVAAWMIAPSPANLRTALDQGTPGNGTTGTGKFVLQDSPTLTTQATVQRDNILTGTGVALSLLNSAPATALQVQQNSPVAEWQGNYWTGSASAAFRARAQLDTVAQHLTFSFPDFAASNPTFAGDIRMTPVGGLLLTRPNILTNVVGSNVALFVRNTTAATVGSPTQHSPAIRSDGSAWNTTTGTSQGVYFTHATRALTGATVTGQYVFSASINGAAATDALTIAANATSTTITTPGAYLANRTSGLVGGFLASNITPATVGTPNQDSPTIVQSCASYNSVSTLSEAHDWRSYAAVATAAGTTSSTWKLQRQIAGGGYSDMLTVTSAGNVTIPGNLTSSAAGLAFLANGTGGYFSATRAEAANSTTRGGLWANSGVATNGSQRWSPNLEFQGQGWNVTAGATRVVQARAYIVPLQQASGDPIAKLVFDTQVNGGGLFEQFAIQSDGNVVNTTNALGATTPTVGHWNINNTAAANGAQQNSGAIFLSGQGWDATTGASKAVDFAIQYNPQQQLGNPTGIAGYYFRSNGGAWTLGHSFGSSGAFSAATTITAGTGITATTGTIVATAGSVSALDGFVRGRKNNIATTNTDGVVAENAFAATLGTPVQYSPDIRSLGSAYNSVSTLSESHEWRWTVRPATAAGTTSAVYALGRQINGGGYLDMLTISSAGTIGLAGSATFGTGNVVISGTGNFVAQSGGIFARRPGISTTSTDGFSAENATAATLGTQIQYSPRLRFLGNAWDTSGAVSKSSEFWIEDRPVPGAGGVTGVWSLLASNNGGGANTALSVTDGSGTASSVIVATPGFVSSSRTNTAFAATSINGYFSAARSSPSNGANDVAVLLQNTTVASVGNQIWSPYIRFIGNGWGTTAGTSQTVEFRQFVVPVQGLVPTGNLRFDVNVAGGGAVTLLDLLSNGGMFITNRTAVPGTPTGGGSLYVEAGALKYIGSSGTITTLAAA